MLNEKLNPENLFIQAHTKLGVHVLKIKETNPQEYVGRRHSFFSGMLMAIRAMHTEIGGLKSEDDAVAALNKLTTDTIKALER